MVRSSSRRTSAGRPSRRPIMVSRTFCSMQLLTLDDQEVAEQPHEELELAAGPLPVLDGEAVEGELVEAEAAGFLDDGCGRCGCPGGGRGRGAGRGPGPSGRCRP